MAFQCRCLQLPWSEMRISFIGHFNVSGFTVGMERANSPDGLAKIY
jgi:hypothetical protein